MMTAVLAMTIYKHTKNASVYSMRIDVLKAVGWKIVMIITTIIIIINITISTDSGGMAVTVKCNGRLQRSSRVVEEGELKRRNTMEEVEKLPTSVNTSAASLISTSSVMGEVEGRRRGEQSLDLRSQYTTSPKSGWI